MIEVYKSIIKQLNTLNLFKSILIYNNQPDRLRASKITIDYPSCFIEIKTKNVVNLGSSGYNKMDLDIRIHIIDVELNKKPYIYQLPSYPFMNYINWEDENYQWNFDNYLWQDVFIEEIITPPPIIFDGLMDENFEIFHLRNAINDNIIGFSPYNCSSLSYTNELQEYKHNNLYHWISFYKCHFTDISGVKEINYFKPSLVLWNKVGVQWQNDNELWNENIGLFLNFNSNLIQNID